MVRKVNDLALDAALDYIKDQTDTMWIISEASAASDFDAVKSRRLASATIASTVFGANANGDVSGRKRQVGIVSTMAIDVDGSATHVALVNASASSLTYITQASAQVVTSGNTITTTAWNIELRDPTAP